MANGDGGAAWVAYDHAAAPGHPPAENVHKALSEGVRPSRIEDAVSGETSTAG